MDFREAFLQDRLRCTDCFAERVNWQLSAPLRSVEFALGSCQHCGRQLEYRNGVLLALPSDLTVEAEANQILYDEMALDEESLLAWRATTRNHVHKMTALRKNLRLDGAHTRQLVLEFGIGYGSHAKEIADMGHDVVGIDIAPKFLYGALARFPSLAEALLVAADATQTPFQSQTFNGVFCVATLHHLPEPQSGIREMLRVLAEGGRFCILEPKRFYPTQLLQYLKHPDTEVSAMKMTAKNLLSWVRNCGVTDAKLSYHIFTPNRPRFMIPIYDVVDRACRSSKALGRLSVQLCVSGVK